MIHLTLLFQEIDTFLWERDQKNTILYVSTAYASPPILGKRRRKDVSSFGVLHHGAPNLSGIVGIIVIIISYIGECLSIGEM